MISNTEITAVHFELDERLKKYAERKIARLDHYVPERWREPLHLEIVLTEEDGKAKNRFTCEATLHLPHEVLTAKESTINIYAAVDIAEAKLKSQLLKYKDKSSERLHRRVLRRLRHLGRS